jgi:hypothetical protein
MDIEHWSLDAGASGGVTGRIDLPGVEGGLVLKFDTRSAVPSPLQVQAVQELVAGWSALRDALATALFAWWQAAALLDKTVPPAPASADDVWPAVWLHEMQVPALSAKGDRLVRLEGECDWARDPGLEIGVRDAAHLLYVGPNHGKGLREPRGASPWNYADPAVRDAALAGTPVDADAFDDARLATLGEGRRPWWRPW